MTYSPATLPLISHVEIVVLKSMDASRVEDYLKKAASVTGVTVKETAAMQIAQLWRELPPGQQARCHLPPFGLRFIADGRVICQGSICWECNNIFGDLEGEPFAYSFDAEAAVSKALLTELQRIIEA